MTLKFLCLLASIAICQSVSIEENQIVAEIPRINSGDQLVSSVINDCFHEDGVACLKTKVLTYLDTMLGLNDESARAFETKNVDEVIFERIGRVLNNKEIKVTLPEAVFQNAEVSYRADRGLDIDLPNRPEDNDETNQARGVLKKKLLLPVLLLLKLKMKALMPIFVALIGLKSLKALVLSKLAIGIVVGFLIYQMLNKGGMAMPMTMAPAEPMPYGPPAPTPYGAPAPAPPATPSNSYEPSWEPSGNQGGPYARVWEPSSAQNLAYSGYYPQSSSSGSSSSSSSQSGTSSSSSHGH